MGDFVSDITDVVTKPLGLSSSSAENQAKRNLQELQNIPLPELKNLKLEDNLARLLRQLSPTELKQIQENPQLLQAQMGALGKLEDITAGGGLSAADRGRIGQIGREEAIAERGQRQALMQNAQARGLGGSGLELSSLLGAQQAGANRAANRDIDVENLAQQRALQAINAQGELAGNIRGQEFDQAARAAQAQDIINQFNTSGYNKARLAGANIRNQQRIYNTQELPQQRYQNQLARFGQTSALNNQIAAGKDAQANTLFNAAANIGSAIATAPRRSMQFGPADFGQGENLNYRFR
jgi:hypothetical protein